MLPFSSRHGVVAPPAEGIASEDSPYGKEEANKKAPFSEGFYRILRAGGDKSATRRLERRNIFLIKSDQKYADIFHIRFLHPCRLRLFSIMRKRAAALLFLPYRKLRKMDLAVLPCSSARKAKIGEHFPAGVARFLL